MNTIFICSGSRDSCLVTLASVLNDLSMLIQNEKCNEVCNCHDDCQLYKSCATFVVKLSRLNMDMGQLSMSVKQTEKYTEVLHFVIRDGIVPEFCFGPVLSFQQLNKKKLMPQCSIHHLMFLVRYELFIFHVLYINKALD